MDEGTGALAIYLAGDVVTVATESEVNAVATAAMGGHLN